MYMCVKKKNYKKTKLDLDRESDCVELLINEVFKSRVIPFRDHRERVCRGSIIQSY